MHNPEMETQPRNGRSGLFGFGRLLSIGTDPSESTPSTRTIRLTNASALIGAMTHVLYGLFYSSYDLAHFLPVILVIVAAIPTLLSVLLLNHKKNHLFASIVLNVSTPLFVFLNLFFFLGEKVGNHYFFILFSLLPLITFPLGNWRWSYALSGFSVLCFLLTFAREPTMDLAGVLGDPILWLFSRSSLLFSLLTIVAVTGVYQALLQRSETHLLRHNKTLGEAMKQVHQLAETDSLTGLSNRRHLDASLSVALQLLITSQQLPL